MLCLCATTLPHDDRAEVCATALFSWVLDSGICGTWDEASGSDLTSSLRDSFRISLSVFCVLPISTLLCLDNGCGRSD